MQHIKICDDERQASDWKKIFANHISCERLVSILYKEISNSLVKSINNPVRKWAIDTRDITLKQIYKWQIATWKDVWHH